MSSDFRGSGNLTTFMFCKSLILLVRKITLSNKSMKQATGAAPQRLPTAPSRPTGRGGAAPGGDELVPCFLKRKI